MSFAWALQPLTGCDIVKITVDLGFYTSEPALQRLVVLIPNQQFRVCYYVDKVMSKL